MLKYFCKKSKNVSLLIIFLATGFIVLNLFSLNISSFALVNKLNNNNDEFNIITAADFGCSQRLKKYQKYRKI